MPPFEWGLDAMFAKPGAAPAAVALGLGAGLVLARQFLDFVPGVLCIQLQRQSGTTAINALRRSAQVAGAWAENRFLRH